ncbi:protein spinster isoform X2 [Teleopsis dalmanni]|uniref:protein spinster isoform X2 n=1 Tax=Teleopsis dalmanni TaxID=139649 RepID=UPI0018CDD259|nr:protein spinster isoform X2 [Teleopsis dalmanni]
MAKQYQPIPMDNPAINRNSDVSNDDADHSSVEGGGGLPSTHSSQQLVGSESSDNSDVRIMNATRNTNRFLRVTHSAAFTVGVLCFVNLINYMDRFTIAGVLTDIQTDFKIGDDEAGLLQTAFVLSYMICAPIFGYLGDRYSRRCIMAIGVLLWSTTTLLGSYMNHFGWFIAFRALVGIGEASYSTIAPTIISDLFVDDMRSKMLAMFYFAIPVGSGFGYIVGSETARIANNWRWALRVTPFLGIAAVILILLVKDPERGESEGGHNLRPTTYTEDVKDLVKNRSFMLSTAGFTCVAFVAGALAWWGPKFIFLGLKMQAGNEDLEQNDVSYKFGIIAMIAGLIGVPLGAYVAQRLRPLIENCDPYICAVGLLVSAPMVFAALVMPQISPFLCFFFVFFAQLSLNLCWSIVADILLYVVVPTRRSTAEAFQILISHALGDAGSPYLVGVLSEAIKKHFRNITHISSNLATEPLQSLSLTLEMMNFNQTSNDTLLTTTTLAPSVFNNDAAIFEDDTPLTMFKALQYALFSTSFVEVLGGIFFLITAAFILKDKHRASQAARGYELRNIRVDINSKQSESEGSEMLVMCTDMTFEDRL